MSSKVIFRCDGNTNIGMGHVVRCLALADMLKSHFELTFAINNPDDNVLKIIKEVVTDVIKLNGDDNESSSFISNLQATDIVVLDGYHFRTDYQQKIKAIGCKLVYIDDLIAFPHYADVIINQAQHIYPANYKAQLNSQLYLGLDYALLRPAFFQKEKEIPHSEIKKVIISMGAADIHNLSLKFAKALLKSNNIIEVNLILGAVNPHLNEIDEFIQSHKNFSFKKHFNLNAEEISNLLSQNHLIICPASGIILEACAIGIAIISGYSADNQIDNLLGFEKEGILTNLGDLQDISENKIMEIIDKLSEEPILLEQQIKKQKALIDKKSPERLVKIFKNLENDKLHFRFATANDVLQYYEWTNDETVRQQSFNQAEISLEDHTAWFNKKLQSENCYFYIFLEDYTKKAVGQIRIDSNDRENIIGISIDNNFRGKGFGEEMVRKASKHYLQNNPNTNITAYIKLENIASYKTFLKAGFILEKEVEINGSKSYKLYKN